MTDTHIGLLSPELETLLVKATPEQRRAACLIALDMALIDNPIVDPLVAETLRNLHLNQVPSPGDVAALKALADEYDQKYGETRMAFEERGEGTKRGFEEAFWRFNAVSAVAYAAHDSETSNGAGTAIYEASAAVENVPVFKSRVASCLQ